MRELKFRVWDHTNNEFVDDMCLHIDGTLMCDCGKSGYVGDFTIQQFTGLKDKNGKEIYEGDIMKTLPLKIVEKINGSFILDDPKSKESRNKMLKEHLEKGDMFMYMGVKNSLTHLSWNLHLSIIGNIFENPELLK